MKQESPCGNHGFKFTSGGKKEDEEWKKGFVRKSIEKAQETSITLLGITEHNAVSWIGYMKEAGVGTRVLVVPGFEITVTGDKN